MLLPVPVLVLNKIPMQRVQTSQSRFILLLSTLLPHAVRWIRSTSCSRIQHEKIQVNFLCFQLKLKAVTSHWDQFITSVLVRARPYCVKDRQGNTSGMWCVSWWFNSLFAVQLSRSASGVFFNFPCFCSPHQQQCWGRQSRCCPERWKRFQLSYSSGNRDTKLVII